jgi:predicted MarR family transcription regulator
MSRSGTKRDKPVTGTDSKTRPTKPNEFVPSPLSRDLSDMEFAFFTLMYGFQTWVETCMNAADVRGLKSTDILVLHAVNHRARGRRQSEICMVLNIEDTHLVAYALKKLMAADLVRAIADGRERHYETTAKGEAACLAYRRIREEFLVPNLSWVASRDGILRETAGFLKTMTAVYSQAGRFATAATASRPQSPPVRTKR